MSDGWRGQPRDSDGRWTDGPGWHAGSHAGERVGQTDIPGVHLHERHETTFSRTGPDGTRKVRAFVVVPPKATGDWDHKRYEWTVGRASVEPAGGATIRTHSEADAEALAERLARTHATKGAKAAQAEAKEARLALEAEAKAGVERLKVNPRVGDKVIDNPLYGNGKTPYEVKGFVHDGGATYLNVSVGGGAPRAMALTEWAKLARSARNGLGVAREGQTFNEFEDQRLGAGTAQAHRDAVEDKRKRRAAAMKARETYKRNKAAEWVAWADKGLEPGREAVGPYVGKKYINERPAKETHTPGVVRSEEYDERGQRTTGYGSNAARGFDTTGLLLPRTEAEKKTPASRDYHCRYDRQDRGSEYAVRDNMGSWINYLPSEAAAERVAYLLAKTFHEGGEKALSKVQYAIGGLTEAERERQSRRDWQTGKYEAYDGCEVCDKPVAWNGAYSYDHADTTVTHEGKGHNFGGLGLHLCKQCAGKLEKMPIPQAHAILTGKAPMPTKAKAVTKSVGWRAGSEG
jgi:hypothetical protein